jgi:hypothetical protein
MHMVPAHFVSMEKFQLTPNKKVDRKALPPPQNNVAATPAPIVAGNPANNSGDTMSLIALVWQRVLGVQNIAPTDNFFALGGHSLLAVQAHRDLREVLGLPGLSITDIFRFPILSALAGHLDKKLRPTPKMAAPATASQTEDQANSRLDAMSKRRAMRADRLSRTG